MKRFAFTLIALVVWGICSLIVWQYGIDTAPTLAVEQFRQNDSTMMIRTHDIISYLGWVWVLVLLAVAYDVYRLCRGMISETKTTTTV